MKKMLAILLALLLTTAMLTGCGGSTGAAMDSMENGFVEEQKAPLYGNSVESPGAAAGTLDSSLSVSEGTLVEQKLIREVSINAETEDLETLLNALTEQISALGGYVENQEVYNGSAYASYRYRSASLTVRIPAENLNSFVAQVKGISNVVNFTESTDDVTLSYVATESRVAALEAEEERLLELMEQAETMTDLLEIEARLTDVRSELEVTASQLRVLANKVSYATVYLTLDQVRVLTEVEEQTVWQRIAGGFGDNLRDIGEDLVDFFIWVVTYSPQLIFWTAVIIVAVSVIRRKLKKRAAKKAVKDTEE